MAKSKITHTVIRNSGLFCLNCGGKHKLPDTFEVKLLNKYINAFNVLHGECPKTWSEPTYDSSMHEIERLNLWINEGERGTSSETMVWAYYDKTEMSLPLNYPLDPDDFHRCYKLWKLVPEIERGFPTLKELSPHWAAIIDNWEKLCGMIEAQFKDWHKPSDMYEFMQEILSTK